MNISWLKNLVTPIAHALEPIAHHVSAALVKAVQRTGEEAHALVNKAGHFVVVTAKEAEQGLEHLAGFDFVHVATIKPADGAMPGATPDQLTELLQRMRALEEANARLMQQRDQAIANTTAVAAEAPATTPAPTAAPSVPNIAPITGAPLIGKL